MTNTELKMENSGQSPIFSAKIGDCPEFSYALAVSLILSLLFAGTAWGKGALPRKLETFELGSQYAELMPRITAFSCKQLGAVATECTAMGYPARDDFLVLEFYQGELVSVIHFRGGTNFDQFNKDVQKKLGKPTMPEYKSDRAVSYIWNDKRTYLTLTHLIPIDYLVYQIRDVVKEPLYRKATGSK